jgi:hypothetical protein
VLSESSMKERTINPRTPEEMVEDRLRCERLLWSLRCFRKGGVDGNRVTMQTYDGRELLNDAHSMSLNKIGIDRISSYVKKLKAGETIKFPPGVCMTQDELNNGFKKAVETIRAISDDNDRDNDDNDEEKND